MCTKLFRSVILGAPAAGKGTIAKQIVTKFNYEHISSGDILRNNVKNGTALGKEVKSYLDSGSYVPDSLVTKCILDQINSIQNKSWLLDGFPRTLEQAIALNASNKPHFIINIVISTDKLVERSSGRWTHLSSGRVYHTEFKPPKVPFKDDVTGEDLIQREDDNPSTVIKRIKLYLSEIDPVIKLYRKDRIIEDFVSNADIWKNVEEFVTKKHAAC